MRSRFFSWSFVYSPLSDSIVILLSTLFTEISSTLARPDCSTEHPYTATTGLKEAYKSGGNAPANNLFLTFRHSSPPSLTVDLKGPTRQPSACRSNSTHAPLCLHFHSRPLRHQHRLLMLSLKQERHPARPQTSCRKKTCTCLVHILCWRKVKREGVW